MIQAACRLPAVGRSVEGACFLPAARSYGRLASLTPSIHAPAAAAAGRAPHAPQTKATESRRAEFPDMQLSLISNQYDSSAHPVGYIFR